MPGSLQALGSGWLLLQPPPARSNSYPWARRGWAVAAGRRGKGGGAHGSWRGGAGFAPLATGAGAAPGLPVAPGSGGGGTMGGVGAAGGAGGCMSECVQCPGHACVCVQWM